MNLATNVGLSQLDLRRFMATLAEVSGSPAGAPSGGMRLANSSAERTLREMCIIAAGDHDGGRR
jgi:hypothetical protein